MIYRYREKKEKYENTCYMLDGQFIPVYPVNIRAKNVPLGKNCLFVYTFKHIEM